MGSALGGTQRKENVNMLTPEQSSAFSQTVSQVGPEAIQALMQSLGGMGQEEMQDLFQQSYVDPAMQAFQQQMIPSIQQSFGDANAGSSSALNQALAQGASNLSTQLGGQYGQFVQGQQNRQLGALSRFMPLLTNQTFSPQFQQKQGWLSPLIGAGGNAFGGWLGGPSKQ